MAIRDDFFANKAIGALWDVSVSMKRGNPLPLDSNSVFESYGALQTYASGVLAYPGQVVAVVEETSTGIYYLDQELNIQEVGKVPVGDNKSIEINDEKISLKNFGKFFYKYTEEGYVKTEVSVNDPWKAGLEPKVVSEDDELVLGWYESNPTTVEGLNGEITTLKGRVDTVEEGLGNVYTKEETANLVASAGHLKRAIVEVLPSIDEADENTIYMVAYEGGAQGVSNVYEEFMVIEDSKGDKHFEKIGDTKTNLEGYATETYVGEQIATSEESIQSKLDAKADTTALDAYVTTEALTTALANKVTNDGLAEQLADYVKTEALNEEVEKLSASIGAKLDISTYNTEKEAFATKTELAEAIGEAPTLSDEGEYEGATGIYVDIYTKDEVSKLIADITGGESAADVLAALNAYKSSNDARSTKIESDATALTERVVTLEAKEDFELKVATTEILGGVKSSDVENAVAVSAEGIMTVNSLNVSKLAQTKGEWLILDGGNSSLTINEEV